MSENKKMTFKELSSDDIKIFKGMFDLSRKSKEKINRFLKEMQGWTKEDPRPSDERIIKV